MKFCRNCGAQLIEGMKFCQNCGQKVVEDPVPAEPPIPPAEPPVQQSGAASEPETGASAAGFAWQPPQEQPWDAPDLTEGPPITGSYTIPGTGAPSAPPPPPPAPEPEPKPIWETSSSPESSRFEPPPPENGRFTPPPEFGSFTPPPSETGGFAPPPPDYGSFTPPPPENGGFAPPPPDYGGFTPPPPPAGGKPPKAKKSRNLTVLIFAAIGVVLVILVIVLIVMLFSGKNDSPADTDYWVLTATAGEGREDTITSEELNEVASLGVQMFLVFDEDGTGAFNLVFPMRMTWDEDYLYVDDDGYLESMAYELDDDQLEVELDDLTLYFDPMDGTPPEIDWDFWEDDEWIGLDEPPAQPDQEDLSWWEGDWYGWWFIDDASENNEDLIDRGCDAYATIELTGRAEGYLEFWDEYDAEGTCTMKADVSFSVGETDYGKMDVESGSFFHESGRGDIPRLSWSVEPDYPMILPSYEDLIVIYDTYVNEDDEDDWFDYFIILRPWGTEWEDIRNTDPSEMYYEDMMPFGYDDWYLPLLEMGVTEMPDSRAEGDALLN